MSMELWILSDNRLNSMADWQEAIDVEGYPLKLSTEVSFESLNGLLPCSLGGKPTGFECYQDNAAELMRAHSDIDFGHSWQHVLGLRWLGSKKDELRAAWIAAAAYAQATSGVVFDGQEGKVRDAAEAREVAKVEYEAPEVDLDIGPIVDRLLRQLKLGPYRES
jgi:hypothetical protein